MSTKGVSTVASDDSGKLVKHIDEAKDWLDKAKQEYTQANPIRGEMTLNLAQAEIKYAWELSHVRFVSQNNNQGKPGEGKPGEGKPGEGKPGEGKPRLRNFQSRLVLPMAATVLVVFTVSLLWFEGRTPLTPQKVALVEGTMAGNELFGAFIGPAAIAPKPTGANQMNENQLVVVGAETTATPETPTEMQPSAKMQPDTEPKSELPSNSIVQVPISGDSTVLTESDPVVGGRSDLAYGNNQSNLQPVSQLTIDVDALTMEATHSLRNGK